MSKEKDKTIKFADRSAALRELYAGEDEIRNLLNSSGGRGRPPMKREEYNRMMSNLKSAGNKKIAVDTSKEAYATQRQYANVVDYLTNMYLWRYYYVPVKKEERRANGNLTYSEIYDIITDVMDGMNVKVTFPNILAKLFIEGEVFLYNVKDEAANTVSTLTLPAEFCTPVMVSQYGTGIYRFKLSYFDSFNLRKEALADLLTLFPKEITDAYFAYKNKNGEKEIIIDGRYGAYIQINETGTPPFLGMIGSLIDYQDYKKNELQKNSSELDSILVNRIPIYEDRPIFEVPEARSLHTAVAKSLAGNDRLRLLTTFGGVERIPLQEKSSVQNDTIRKAHEAVYYDSGLNTSIFNEKTREGVEASLKRDASFV